MFADWWPCHAKPTIKNVPEYIMRIGAKDHSFAPNLTIKRLISSKYSLGREYSVYILPRKIVVGLKLIVAEPKLIVVLLN